MGLLTLLEETKTPYRDFCWCWVHVKPLPVSLHKRHNIECAVLVDDRPAGTHNCGVFCLVWGRSWWYNNGKTVYDKHHGYGVSSASSLWCGYQIMPGRTEMPTFASAIEEAYNRVVTFRQTLEADRERIEASRKRAEDSSKRIQAMLGRGR